MNKFNQLCILAHRLRFFRGSMIITNNLRLCQTMIMYRFDSNFSNHDWIEGTYCYEDSTKGIDSECVCDNNLRDEEL